VPTGKAGVLPGVKGDEGGDVGEEDDELPLPPPPPPHDPSSTALEMPIETSQRFDTEKPIAPPAYPFVCSRRRKLLRTRFSDNGTFVLV
jgi:hypothetical protein